MSTYNLLPGNTSYRRIQAIPVDTANQLRHADNGSDAAVKSQNLNTKVTDAAITVDYTSNFIISTTVSSTTGTFTDLSGNVFTAPCYQVCISGGSNGPILTGESLTLVGGFPSTQTSAQVVDSSIPTNILPQSSMTYYRATGLVAEPATPEVYLMAGTSVTLVDIPTTAYPYWQITLPDSYTAQAPSGILQFNICFNLLIAPSAPTPF